MKEVLQLPRLRMFTESQVEEGVKLNDKQRFTMKRDDKGEYIIRANQGHTIRVKIFASKNVPFSLQKLWNFNQ